MNIPKAALITFLIGTSPIAHAESDSQLLASISDPSYPKNVAGLPTAQHPAKPEHLKKWQEAKFGLFIHWGIYSVLEGKWKGKEIPDLGEQIQRHAKIPGKEYVEVAKQFNPVKFDGRAYAKLAKDAGMTYMVLTSRHHDGFSMFDTAHSEFDIIDATPYKKDIVKALADGCKAEDLQFGLYYSNPDWHFGIDPEKKEFNVGWGYSPELLKFEQNQLTELLTNYGPIMEIFFDMGKPSMADSLALAKTVRDLQPECLVSGRVMNNQGDFYTLSDNAEAKEVLDLPWEAPSTFHSKPGHTWGWKSWVVDPPMDKEVARCVQKLSRVTSRGGNFLLNIGPKPDGTVSAYQTEALQTIGKWVAAHRGSIFGVNTTPFQRSPWGTATWKGNELYLHIAKWPRGGKLKLPDLVSEVVDVRLFNDSSVKYKFSKLPDGGVELLLPEKPVNPYQTVISVLCASEVVASQPKVVQTDPHRIELGQDELMNKSFIHGMTYACMVKNVRNHWSFKVKESGTYSAKLFVDVKKQKPRRNQKPDMSPQPVLVSIGEKLFHIDVPVTLGPAEITLGNVELNAGDSLQAIVVKDLSRGESSDDSPRRFSLEPIWPQRIVLSKNAKP